MPTYYDGTKLLSMLDSNGNKPEIFICTGNRTSGKTTYFNRMAVNGFIKKNRKFILLYRFIQELDNVEEKFFKDIGSLFFNDYVFTAKKRSKTPFVHLFLQHRSQEEAANCGYAIALNGADTIKKNSHLFSDCSCILFDEFQSETNNYCSDEMAKFHSIHTSLARGQGKQVKYLPVYMLSNCVSILNPYFVALGISNRIKSDTKFLKGDGYVLEQSYNESAAEAQKESAFNRAFSNSDYLAYSTQNVYLQDNTAFISSMKGKSKYICTLKCDGQHYALREFTDEGIIYCDDRPDMTFRGKIAVTTDDHNINYVMLKRNELFFINMRYLFNNGCFRFKNLQCKDAVLKALIHV